MSKPLPPAADALNGESGGIAVNANVHPALVGGDIVDAIGRCLAQFFDLEVVNANRLRVSPAA